MEYWGVGVLGCWSIGVLNYQDARGFHSAPSLPSTPLLHHPIPRLHPIHAGSTLQLNTRWTIHTAATNAMTTEPNFNVTSR